MSTKHPIITKTYELLTITQAEQVDREYPQHTDPHQYTYDVDTKTNKVVTRYKITHVEQVTA
jgi:hypothetical protein